MKKNDLNHNHGVARSLAGHHMCGLGQTRQDVDAMSIQYVKFQKIRYDTIISIHPSQQEPSPGLSMVPEGLYKTGYTPIEQSSKSLSLSLSFH